MKSSVAAVLALLALAACESDGDAPAEPVVAAPTAYERQTTTDDLTVRILIPASARALTVIGDRLVAEAEAEANEIARRAAERRRESGEGRFTPSELIVVWSVAWEDAGAVSLLRRTRTFEGGFATEEGQSSLLVDRATGRTLGVSDLFADPRPNGPAMTAVSEAAFAAWAEVSPAVAGRDLALVDEYALTDARETLRPRASSFETFVLVPDEDDRSHIGGVELIYPAGMLGSPADGPFTLFIPAEVLAPHLAPAWAARLAGGAGGEPVENLNSAP
jgi:hypothetical protein